MDSAALTAIRQMPNWIPARESGMRVRCKYSVPVQFKIEKPKPAPQKPVTPVKTSATPKDTIPTDSLANDSLKLLGLSGDSIKQMPVQLKRDSLLLKGDSLSFQTDSLTILNDSTVLKNDSTALKPATDTPADKPKKRNIFVRFFRWLFGIKD